MTFLYYPVSDCAGHHLSLPLHQRGGERSSASGLLPLDLSLHDSRDRRLVQHGGTTHVLAKLDEVLATSTARDPSSMAARITPS